MKKALVAICASLLTASTIAAIPFHKRIIENSVECFSGEYLPDFMVRFGEEPLLLFRTHRVKKDKELLNETVLLINPKTKSWSIVEVFDEQNYCVIAYGLDAIQANDALMQQKPKKYY